MTEKLLPAVVPDQKPLRKLSESDLPLVIKAAGSASAYAYEEFIFGRVRNKHPRRAYQHALLDYLNAAGIDGSDKNAPLFRTAVGKKKQLTCNPMTDNDMQRMFKRRIVDAGLPAGLSPHSFRVTTITALLDQGVPLEDVQNLANHADPRTTRLYDRRKRKVTRNIVERIPIYAEVQE